MSHSLESVSHAHPHPPTQQDEEDGVFRLAPNNVTVLCPRVPANATGVVNGVTYTKRGREDLLALVKSKSWGELETSCTSDSVDFSELFRDAEGFNADISSWDVASVRSMEGMFRGASGFDRDISSWSTPRVSTMKYMCVHWTCVTTRSLDYWTTGPP